MGAFLEKPKTEKLTLSGEGNGIKFGVSAMQGWRMEMEDAHVCEIKKDYSFFGVFDGHAGPKVAQYCSKNLLGCIVGSNKEGPLELEDLKKAITKGFLELDDKMMNSEVWSSGQDRSGSTAIVVMLTPENIIWGNCGDSRGILCANGKAKFATMDHKPYNQVERERIEKAGGTVMMQRVNGSLAVSRALGDFDYKRSTHLPKIEQLVSPEPEVVVQPRDSANDQFLILACDGIFDVMKNEEVVDYVSHQLEITDDLPKICSSLIDTCLAKNSRDNMSVILVTFPAAPKVSREAIEKETKLKEEARQQIDKRIDEIANSAFESLDLDESAVFQQLENELPPGRYDIYSMRDEINAKVLEKRKQKFGVDEEFTGPSDPADAPTSFSGTMEEVFGNYSNEEQPLYPPQSVEPAIDAQLSLPADSDTAATVDKKDSIPDKTIM